MQESDLNQWKKYVQKLNTQFINTFIEIYYKDGTGPYLQHSVHKGFRYGRRQLSIVTNQLYKKHANIGQSPWDIFISYKWNEETCMGGRGTCICCFPVPMEKKYFIRPIENIKWRPNSDAKSSLNSTFYFLANDLETL